LMDPIMAEKKEYTTRYYQLRQDCSRVRTLWIHSVTIVCS
jgi:hypothetical protein